MAELIGENTIWEAPISYDKEENQYTGWTIPIKFSDDLPLVALSVTISTYDDEADDEIWYADSCIWVVDESHELAPAFVNMPSSIGLLIGGGIPLFEDWNHNFYNYANRDIQELIEDTIDDTLTIINTKPNWFVNELRAEIEHYTDH